MLENAVERLQKSLYQVAHVETITCLYYGNGIMKTAVRGLRNKKHADERRRNSCFFLQIKTAE